MIGNRGRGGGSYDPTGYGSLGSAHKTGRGLGKLYKIYMVWQEGVEKIVNLELIKGRDVRLGWG